MATRALRRHLKVQLLQPLRWGHGAAFHAEAVPPDPAQRHGPAEQEHRPGAQPGGLGGAGEAGSRPKPENRLGWSWLFLVAPVDWRCLQGKPGAKHRYFFLRGGGAILPLNSLILLDKLHADRQYLDGLGRIARWFPGRPLAVLSPQEPRFPI